MPKDPELAAALIAVIGALLGTVIGVALAEFLAWRRRTRQEEKERSNIRLALYYEIADNLAALMTTWDVITAPGSPTEGLTPLVMAQRLMRVAPVWSTNVWQGIAASIPAALYERELDASYRLYRVMAGIGETRVRLQAARDTDFANRSLRPTPRKPLTMEQHEARVRANYAAFESAANKLMPDLAEQVQAVLAAGNPLPRP